MQVADGGVRRGFMTVLLPRNKLVYRLPWEAKQYVIVSDDAVPARVPSGTRRHPCLFRHYRRRHAAMTLL